MNKILRTNKCNHILWSFKVCFTLEETISPMRPTTSVFVLFLFHHCSFGEWKGLLSALYNCRCKMVQLTEILWGVTMPKYNQTHQWFLKIAKNHDKSCCTPKTNTTLLINYAEKAMATHSSTLAWKIPGTREPGGLPSVGSHRVGHDWSDLAAAAAAINYEYKIKILLTKKNMTNLLNYPSVHHF